MKSEEFIREVDEELRRDRFAHAVAALRRPWSWALAVLIVAGTAGKVGWDHWRRRRARPRRMRFAAAQQALQADRPGRGGRPVRGPGSRRQDRLRGAGPAEGGRGQARPEGRRPGPWRRSTASPPAAGATRSCASSAPLLAVERQLDTGDPADAQAHAGASGRRRGTLAQPGPRAPGAGSRSAPATSTRRAAILAGAEQGSRRAALAAAAGRRAAAGDRGRRAAGQLMSALSRRRLRLTAAATPCLAGCGEGTWLGETPAAAPARRAQVGAADRGPAQRRPAPGHSSTSPCHRRSRNPDWPQVRRQRHPRHAASRRPPTRIAVAWRTGIGAGAGGGSRLLAGPVVAGGRVFAVDADGMTTAVDAATGSEVVAVRPR